MRRIHIETIPQLLRFARNELETYKGFGPRVLNEIETKLLVHGLHLRRAELRNESFDRRYDIDPKFGRIRGATIVIQRALHKIQELTGFEFEQIQKFADDYLLYDNSTYDLFSILFKKSRLQGLRFGGRVWFKENESQRSLLFWTQLSNPIVFLVGLIVLKVWNIGLITLGSITIFTAVVCDWVARKLSPIIVSEKAMYDIAQKANLITPEQHSILLNQISNSLTARRRSELHLQQTESAVNTVGAGKRAELRSREFIHEELEEIPNAEIEEVIKVLQEIGAVAEARQIVLYGNRYRYGKSRASYAHETFEQTPFGYRMEHWSTAPPQTISRVFSAFFVYSCPEI